MEWSSSWKSSTQPRKQRKYRYNAPTHIAKSFLSAHLSSELRKKHNKRNMIVIKGDKVKIMRGKFKNKTGKVEKVNTAYAKVMVSDIELSKKDGSKREYLIDASNVMITELNLSDKKRVEILARKKSDTDGKKSS